MADDEEYPILDDEPETPEAKRLREEQELLADTWNGKYKVGTKVNVTQEDGTVKEGYTRTNANMVDGKATIWVRGQGRCPISRITPVDLPNRPLDAPQEPRRDLLPGEVQKQIDYLRSLFTSPTLKVFHAELEDVFVARSEGLRVAIRNHILFADRPEKNSLLRNWFHSMGVKDPDDMTSIRDPFLPSAAS